MILLTLHHQENNLFSFFLTLFNLSPLRLLTQFVRRSVFSASRCVYSCHLFYYSNRADGTMSASFVIAGMPWEKLRNWTSLATLVVLVVINFVVIFGESIVRMLYD